MHPRQALTLQTQLLLPSIPLIIDTFARCLLLSEKIPWFEIPDLVTLLVTYAFFCLGVMFNVNAPKIPSDTEEVNLTVELVRQKLLANAIFAVCLAGGVSFFRAFDELLPERKIYQTYGAVLFIAVLLLVGLGCFQIKRKYLSHVHREN